MNVLVENLDEFIGDGIFSVLKKDDPFDLYTRFSYSDRIILYYLGKVEESSMGDLAKHVHIANSTLNYMVKQLIKRGFIEARKATHDKRIILVKLTKSGRREKDELVTIFQNRFSRLAEKLELKV